jgi:hypothetical protein
MSGDRVGMLRRSGLSADEMLSIAEEQAGVVRPLGRNPMKVAR